MTKDNEHILDALLGNDNERIQNLSSYFRSKLITDFDRLRHSGGFEYINNAFVLLIDEISRMEAQLRLCRDLVAGLSPNATATLQQRIKLNELPREMSAPTHFTYRAASPPIGPGLSHHETDQIGDFRWVLGDEVWSLSTRIKYENAIRVEIFARPFHPSIDPGALEISLNGTPCQYEFNDKNHTITVNYSEQNSYHFSVIHFSLKSKSHFSVTPDPRKLAFMIEKVEIYSDLNEKTVGIAPPFDLAATA